MIRAFFMIIILFNFQIILNAQQKLVSETRQVFDANLGRWQNDEKEVYEYDATSQKLTSWNTYKWSPKNQNYRDKTTRTYNENGSIESEFNLFKLDEGFSTIRDSTFYIYAVDNLLIERNKNSWISSNFKEEERAEYFYDDSKRLIAFSLFEAAGNDNLSLARQEILTYNEAGCLETKYVEDYKVSALRRETTTTFSYGENCILEKEKIYDVFFFLQNSDAIREYEIFYYQNQNGQNRIDSLVHLKKDETTDGGLEFYLTEVREYDVDSQVIRYEYLSENVTGDANLYFYDDKKNLIREENWRVRPDTKEWFNQRVKEFDYSYDENDFLMKTAFYDDGILQEETIYENFCDGLPKSIQIRDTNLTGSLTNSNRLTFLEYEEGADCEDTESLENIVIYPNPASDFLIINSDVLNLGNSDITILNGLGQIILFFENVPRSSRFEINIQSLTAGSYFLKIDNLEKSIIQQIIKTP
jgi:hypothetical protein